MKLSISWHWKSHQSTTRMYSDAGAKAFQSTKCHPNCNFLTYWLLQTNSEKYRRGVKNTIVQQNCWRHQMNKCGLILKTENHCVSVLLWQCVMDVCFRASRSELVKQLLLGKTSDTQDTRSPSFSNGHYTSSESPNLQKNNTRRDLTRFSLTESHSTWTKHLTATSVSCSVVTTLCFYSPFGNLCYTIFISL